MLVRTTACADLLVELRPDGSNSGPALRKAGGTTTRNRCQILVLVGQDRAADRGWTLKNAANCGFRSTQAFDKSAPIFRIALMGADENAETKSKAVEPSFSPSILEKLDAGWTISEQGEGQLVLVPPPHYGDAPSG